MCEKCRFKTNVICEIPAVDRHVAQYCTCAGRNSRNLIQLRLYAFQSASLRDAMSVIHNVRLPSALVTSLRCQSVAIGDAMMTSLLELACKLTCNAITTCGYILYGKVYENYMIDLAVR